MCVVFFQFFFYEGRFGEDRDIVVRGVRVANPKAKAGSHRKTDLKYMMLSKNIYIFQISPTMGTSFRFRVFPLGPAYYDRCLYLHPKRPSVF